MWTFVQSQESDFWGAREISHKHMMAIYRLKETIEELENTRFKKKNLKY